MQFQHIFFVLFGLVAATVLFKVIKGRGFRGAMFGAPLRKLVSEIELETRGMVKTKLKVHILDPRDASAGPHVGVEVVHSTFGSWQMSPIALTRSEAQRLAEQLTAASRESASGGTHG
jgi:hypothetical protein